MRSFFCSLSTLTFLTFVSAHALRPRVSSTPVQSCTYSCPSLPAKSIYYYDYQYGSPPEGTVYTAQDLLECFYGCYGSDCACMYALDTGVLYATGYYASDGINCAGTAIATCTTTYKVTRDEALPVRAQHENRVKGDAVAVRRFQQHA